MVGLTGREIVQLSIIGALAGLLSGLLGVGGGIVLVPLMVSWLGLTQHQAHGTSLAVIVFTVLSSLLSYAYSGTIDVGIAILLTIGSVIGVRLGALWMTRVPARRLRQIFGAFLLIVGIRLVAPFPSSPWMVMVDASSLVGSGVVMTIGLATGILSGFLGVGGGIIMVPAMTLLLGIVQQTAQGISLLVIIPTSMVGALTHLQKGNVVKSYVPWLAAAAMITAALGSALAHSLPAATLRQVFGLFLLTVSFQIIASARHMADMRHRR